MVRSETVTPAAPADALIGARFAEAEYLALRCVHSLAPFEIAIIFPHAPAEVRGLQLTCNLAFFWAGWQKIVAQIRGVFRKIFIYYPLWERNLGRKHVFTPIFCLHTVTTGSGFTTFGYSLSTFHLLTEIYPMVPFPPSVR